MNDTILALISELNNTDYSIPLSIKMVSEQVPYQFYISIILAVIGSIFVFFFLWSFIKPMVSGAIINIKLSKLVKKNKRSMIIIKHTEQGLFGGSMINQNTLKKIIRALQKFKGKAFDLVIYSPGGYVFFATYLSRLLKNYPGKIRSIIPIYAMSGGTLLALTGDEILMNESACLGAVDPQLGNLFRYGSANSWNHIVKFKGKKAEDQSISFALTGKQVTKSIRKFINELIKDKIKNKKKRNKFLDFLTKGDIEHAYPIDMNMLKSYGLDVKLIDPSMSEVLLKVLSSDTFEGVYAIKYKPKKIMF